MNKKRLLIIIGIVAAVVVAIVVLDTMLANHLPVITSLEAEPERVLPSASTQIVCTASDADGDELSYNWSAIGGEINGEGATVTWKAPNSVGLYDITVNVTDGRGGEAMKTVTVEVRHNKPPEIKSLTADADWTLRSGSLNITCDATDPDGDELSYKWTASGGNISDTGPEVTWTAPNEVGTYNITVVVIDGHGRSDTEKLCTSVVTGEPPNIEALRITAEHCYLKAYSWGYKVGKDKEYHIECIVAGDGIGLSYDWSCEDGTISGISDDGSMITWTTPDKYLEETNITVTVSDIAGNMVCKSVTLSVVSCSKCTFGC